MTGQIVVMIIDGKQKAYQVNEKTFHCGTNATLYFIGGKWKSVIIWYLRNGEMRFSQLKKLMPDITEKMLSLQLKALQADAILDRKVFGIKPPNRVEYSLTDFGKSFVPVIKKITEWGIEYSESKGRLIDVD
ncbi:winged helix-turn-helix transcriptional regulator [Croceitalea rosinachiae]|uniref:Helix-turn-helix domain-containing protein n=1 Tax=Croceitalea rosinachiae TaxID=3075596 RepID=A0ABU3ABR1_9FLAO|nr:helix-turn-helix domain-containing protein [Croceitalea sp. F388]MDT0607602.1 helix-turn-helix domain-containing protein [Croceitalea sp. F388]